MRVSNFARRQIYFCVGDRDSLSGGEMKGEDKRRKADDTLTFTWFEELLRTAILLSGASYLELAERSGVSLPAISRFVARRRGLTSVNIGKLIASLHLTLV